MSRLITRRAALVALLLSTALVSPADALMRGGLTTSTSGGGGFTDNDWPSDLNRPIATGTTTATLTWVGPSGGGVNNGHPVQQSRVLTNSGGIAATNGQVIVGLNIVGGVSIPTGANNGVLRQCRIVQDGVAITIASGVSGWIIEDCEIVGSGSAAVNTAGILENRTPGANTYRRLNIHGYRNAFIVSSPSLIQDNYCHDFGDAASDAPHYQCIEMDGGITGTTIDHNSLVMDAAEGGATAVIQLNDSGGQFSNITVSNNLLISTGASAVIFEVTNDFNKTPNCTWSCTNNKTILADEAVCSAGSASGTTLTVAGSLSPGPFPPPVIAPNPFSAGQALFAASIPAFLTIGSLGSGSGGLGTYNIAGGTASLSARPIIAYNQFAYWWHETSPVTPSPFTGNVDFYTGLAIPAP